jgi:hypothetical protein
VVVVVVITEEPEEAEIAPRGSGSAAVREAAVAEPILRSKDDILWVPHLGEEEDGEDDWRHS